MQKVRTTIEIINYIPLEKKNDNFIVRWNKENLRFPIYNDKGEIVGYDESTTHCTCDVAILDYQPTVEELQISIPECIDRDTAQDIAYGFLYNRGEQEKYNVPLTQFDINRYNAIYEDKQSSLPAVIEYDAFSRLESFTIETIDELEEFHTQYTNHISEIEQRGSYQKSRINWEDYENYEEAVKEQM